MKKSDPKNSRSITKVFQAMDEEDRNDRMFNAKVLELFKRHNIGTAEDHAFLEGFVAGSV